MPGDRIPSSPNDSPNTHDSTEDDVEEPKSTHSDYEPLRPVSHQNRRRRRGLIVTTVFAITIVIILVAMWPWSQTPRFVLQKAAITSFSATSSALTVTMQVTISSSSHLFFMTAHYSELNAYATYRGRVITAETALPVTGQEQWSALLQGVSVPLDPPLATVVSGDMVGLGMEVHVMVDGRMRWKLGMISFGQDKVEVDCAGLFKFGGSANGFTYMHLQDCIVN